MLVFPNAKINIGLRVVERRKDGFHNIETLFYPLKNLFDVIEILPAKSFDFKVLGQKIDCSIDDNLVVRAYMLLQQEFALPAVHILLKKSIPMGAGLGGGSADATFTLKGLNELFSLGLEDAEIASRAEHLGSDCPFFAYNYPMIGREKGEKLTNHSLDLSGKYLLLVKPDLHISTKDAYEAIVPKQCDIDLGEILNLPISEWGNAVTNDFEKPIFKKHQVLSDIKTAMYRQGALYSAMSGSGSTIYGIFSNEPQMWPDYNKFYQKVIPL